MLIALTAQIAIARLGATLQAFCPFVKLRILTNAANIIIILTEVRGFSARMVVKSYTMASTSLPSRIYPRLSLISRRVPYVSERI